MSGFTTSFIIIPQLASDHRAFHEYDWPMTINTVYTWLGHEELRNAQITAQEWIQRFAGIIVEIKKNLPELKAASFTRYQTGQTTIMAQSKIDKPSKSIMMSSD